MTDLIQNSFTLLSAWFKQLLTESGFSLTAVNWLTIILLFTSLIIVTTGCCYIINKILHGVLYLFGKSPKMKFFNLLLDNKFPYFLSLLAAYYFMQYSIPVILSGHAALIGFFDKLLYIYLVFVIIRTLMTIITAGFDTLREKENYHDRPISSYRQVIQIVLIIIGIALLISKLFDLTIVGLFTGMGAASAILLLMFKDVIMGCVASVQVTSNDMVRIGDWITMPKYGADGDVIEITLTTVKVSNFDKTITTIPTYALISDSFQNWRGMIRSGGRRIKRAIIIKQSSIRYIADDELVRFKKIQGISDYIDKRQEEIRKHNEEIHADRSIPVNGRNLTNAGLFRKYTEWYLNNHPGTNKKMILMVRQLAPTEIGIPLELYVFTNTTKWVEYEYIMADIFDHLIAAVRYFDLHIYERQSGSDVQRLEMVDSDFNQYSAKFDIKDN
jgi:miniconductance mechanosensitive channel